ncbi:MAG TPA: ACP phosphodiesterase [Agriterribacter sp.]|nr:ACP phosphodiesterase [Agriterribacter sp.]
MNYLAHAYLSFLHPEVLVGNMISDFVKGKQKLNYSDNIQKGIMLHRAIDTFTDNHIATKAAKQLFRPFYGLYAGAFMDIVYDHFLAKDNTAFKDPNLLQFSTKTYAQLDQYTHIFPDRFSRLYPYMKKQNWLYNYQYPEGIANSFRGLVHRAAYMADSTTAFQIFEEHHDSLQKYYIDFFPEVIAFAKLQFAAGFPGYHFQ